MQSFPELGLHLQPSTVPENPGEYSSETAVSGPLPTNGHGAQ